MDVQEVRKLDTYLKRVFGNQKIRVVPRPKKNDLLGLRTIGVFLIKRPITVSSREPFIRRT